MTVLRSVAQMKQAADGIQQAMRSTGLRFVPQCFQRRMQQFVDELFHEVLSGWA